jgi:hypothetical protein
MSSSVRLLPPPDLTNLLLKYAGGRSTASEILCDAHAAFQTHGSQCGIAMSELARMWSRAPALDPALQPHLKDTSHLDRDLQRFLKRQLWRRSMPNTVSFQMDGGAKGRHSFLLPHLVSRPQTALCSVQLVLDVASDIDLAKTLHAHANAVFPQS